MSDSRQFEAAASRALEGFIVTDEAGHVTYSNGTAADLLGVERGTLVGESLETQDAVLAERCRQARSTDQELPVDSHELTSGRVVSGAVYPIDGGVATVLRDQDDHERDRGASERALERLHDVTTDPTLTIDGKIDRILEVGAERLGTDHGALAHIEGDTHEIVQAVTVGDVAPALRPGTTTPLSTTYCRHTLDSEDATAIEHTGANRSSDPAYEQFNLECYLGASVHVAGEQYGTVFFVDSEPRERPFSERERTFAELLTSWIHYLLEQRTYERELEQQQAFTESVIDSLPDPLYAFDSEGGLMRWNDQLGAVTGYDESALEGMEPVELVASRDRDRIERAGASVRDGEHVSVEAALETADGEHIPYEFSGAPLRDGSGSVTGLVGIGRDISARTEHQRRLSGLLETTRSFMQAKDPEQVAEIAVNAARELLGFETSVFRLYDPETQTLEPVAVTEEAREALGERPDYGVDEGYPGEVFTTGEPRMIDNLGEAERGPDEIAAVMYYPVGVRGTMSIGSTEAGAFDESDEQLLALLATSAAAACTRAKREQDLREARAHTERVLDRVNGLIRQTVEVLVEATTREELEAGVVRELAAAEPYTFAWFSRPDVAGERLTPTAWAGDANISDSDWSNPIDGSDPLGESYREGRPRLVDTHTLPDDGPWSYLTETVEALVALPLVYKDTTYGVLVVCSDDASALDERERVVLEALGRATANAINAVERGRILDATRTLELEFSVGDPELLFNRLTADGGCIESAGTEVRPDGSVRLYLSGTDVDPDAFLECVRADSEVQSVTCLVAREEECLLEVLVEESLLVTLTEHGAVLQEVVAENGTTRVAVELSYEAEARDLFKLVEKRYPGTELLGYHERERPVETRQDFTADISDRLTDRQETALRTAYLGGFFDWPRGIDGNELADAMDISRPTYHQHLRTAQAKVFEELFE